ncbi:hypothetical protein IVB12_07920 [Bradyrhizobium sp. 179]|uniref:hypothetical protein n=1 Tax=Bradyrhizobium sp. 179 TaxID=2782648 RepID=UPI001FF8DD11|nr:hypothetical protein [Bradyrhizobium sp. 179]MCK1541901.1 hypothetical protein [Bradyrhizobium sp. 179]
MSPFDFRVQAHNGDPLPLVEAEFIFSAYGQSSAHVDHRGIHCAHESILQLVSATNAIELEVINGTPAIITALSLDANGWQSHPRNVPSSPGSQRVTFNVASIQRVALKSESGELFLQTLR